MITKIDHLGIAVTNLEEAIAVYRDGLGLHLERVEEVPTEQVRVAMFAAGESHVELLESTGADGPIAKAIARRGEGIHHIAFTVDDIAGAVQRGRAAGMEFLSDAPRPGAGGTRVIFAHPKTTRGVLIEFVEKPAT